MRHVACACGSRPCVCRASGVCCAPFQNLAFDLEGQATLLKYSEAFDAVVEGLEARTSRAARLASALCLRNLAFSADGRAAMLTRPRCLPALVRALDPSEPPLASRAASALHALVGRCERAKAVVRHGATLDELKVAERALTAAAMVAPPSAHAARASLDETLRGVGALMSILRQ